MKSIIARLAGNDRETAMAEIGNWVIDTCLLFGATPETAYQVAAMFVRGLRENDPTGPKG